MPAGYTRTERSTALAHRVGSKGQVVIDQELREKLGVSPDWTAIQRLVGDHIEIRFLPPEHSESLKGVLEPRNGDRGVPADADWTEVKERAWAEAVDVPKFRPSKPPRDG